MKGLRIAIVLVAAVVMIGSIRDCVHSQSIKDLRAEQEQMELTIEELNRRR